MFEILIAAVPLLFLLGSLLLGRYPGCEAVLRLSERIAGRRRVRTGSRACAPRPRRPGSFAPSGGLLIAFGIAQRPPPLVS